MTTHKARGARVVCTTKLVEQALRDCDDFLTAVQLSERTGRNAKQVWAALLHLRSRHVVGVEIQGTGRSSAPLSYWYALPEQEDERVRTVSEYTPVKRRAHKRRTKSGTIILTKGE